MDLDSYSILVGAGLGALYGTVTSADNNKKRFLKGTIITSYALTTQEKYGQQAALAAIPAYVAMDEVSNSYDVPPVYDIARKKILRSGIKGSKWFKDGLASSVEIEEIEKAEDKLEDEEENLEKVGEELEPEKE